MDTFTHLDLLSVGVAVAGTGLLGFVILFNNLKSSTNRAFFAFALVTVVWSVANYSYYQLPAGPLALSLLRFVMFCATWHAFTFFHLASVFPEDGARMPWWKVYVLIPLVATVSLITLTPYVFERITSVGADGAIGGVANGPAIPLFGMLVTALIVAGIYRLVRKTLKAAPEERHPYSLMLTGMIITFVMLLTFNFFIPAVFNNPTFIPLGGLFLLPFVILTFYAIYKHHLLNLRVVATALLGFLVTIFSFANIIYSRELSAVILNVTAFIIILLGTLRLVRDTLALEELAAELQQTNERQEGLIRFISHEVKGFLTKDEGAFAALLEGDFGPLSEELKPFVSRALAETRGGVESVMTILKASNQKKGTTQYKQEQIDLAALVKKEWTSLEEHAKAKGLTYTLSVDERDAPYAVVGDPGELGDHAIRNLLDNAINYTPSGSVESTLQRDGEYVVFSVKDSGVGITEEDKQRLFTEGGHGANSQSVNVHSTGYGLFITKNIVTAHGGTVDAKSAGPGKGSTFSIRIPAGKKESPQTR